MAKSIKLMVTDPYYASADEIVQPGTLLDADADVPAGMRVTEVIHDDDPPAPAFHLPAGAEPAADAAEDEPPAKGKASAAADDEGSHRSAGGKAGGRA